MISSANADKGIHIAGMEILTRGGFEVLSASNGPSALRLADATDEVIDLLPSDVDMPLMAGPDLGEALKTSRPDMHVMLMSGGNLLVLNYGWAFIQKPFLTAKLIEMVTSALASPDRSQLGGPGIRQLQEHY